MKTKGAIVKLNRHIIRKLIIESLAGKPQRLNEAVEKVQELIPDESALDDLISTRTKDKVNYLQQIIGATPDGVWGDNTNKAWKKWLNDAVKEAYSEEQQEAMLAGVEKATSDWQGFAAESEGKYAANIDGVLKYMFDLANKQVDLENKRSAARVAARSKLLDSINSGIKKLSDKELKDSFNDRRSKAKSTEELKAIQKEVEAAVAKQNKAKLEKKAKSNKLKGWNADSYSSSKVNNINVAKFKIEIASTYHSDYAKKAGAGPDIIRVSIVPNTNYPKEKLFLTAGPDRAFWANKKDVLTPDDMLVGLYSQSGARKIHADGKYAYNDGTTIRTAEQLTKLSELQGAKKNQLFYQAGSRKLGGAELAYMAIKVYGNNKEISKTFAQYAGIETSRKVGAKNESKKLNSKLLRSLILKTLKENGEL